MRIDKRASLLYLAVCLFFVDVGLHAQNAADKDISFAIGTGPNLVVNVVDTLPNGNIFIAGDFQQFNGQARPRIALIQSNGTLDPVFTANTTGGANMAVRSGMVEQAGTILIGGIFSTVNGASKNWFARLQGNGQLSPGFPAGTGPNNEVTAIHANGGRIAISGFFNVYDGYTRPGFAVLTQNGAIDLTFTNQTWSHQIRCQYVLPNNKILVGGNFSTSNGATINRIARLKADGSLDTSFNPGSGPSGPVECITRQPDGKWLIGGSFTSVDGQPRVRIARLNSNGSLDTTFNAGLGFNSTVRGITLQPDGKMIVTGGFSQFNGQAAAFVIRLNANGTRDLTFDVGTGLNGSTARAAIQADGKILVGGGFTQYKGQATPRLMRLLGDTCTSATAPVFSQSSYSAQCTNDTVQLQITGGTLGNAARWEWRTGSCTGPLVDTGWTIDLQPLADTTTLYVQGAGACNCTPVHIFVDDTLAPVPSGIALNVVATCEFQFTVQHVPTALDNCAGVISGTPQGPLYYGAPGTYVLPWLFDDGNGNTTIQNFGVQILPIDTSVIMPSTTLPWELLALHTGAGVKYQWGECVFGQILPVGTADTNQSFVVPYTGEFGVIITDGNCIDTSACHFVMVWDVPEHRVNHLLNLHPNPATDVVRIRYPQRFGDGMLQFFSLRGVLLLESEIIAGSAMELCVSDLPAGMYILNVTTPKASMSQRLFKQ